MRGWQKRVAVMGLLLTALAGASAPEASAAAKTLVVGLVAEPTSMDPGQLTDINSMRVLSSVYDTLIRFKEGSFTQEPGLATAWKMSPDGLTYTFTLRRGVKFHDGTPFDSDAVKFTYDRLLDPKHPFAETGPFPFASFYYGAVKEVAVVDPYTVRFTVKEPFSPLLNNLTLNTVAGATRSFFRVTAPKTVIVIPDTPAKRREYEEEVVRTFYLSNADLKETMDLLRGRVDAGEPVAELMQAVLSETGYLEALEAERTIEAEGRAENLEALVEGAAEFDLEREREGEAEVL